MVDNLKSWLLSTGLNEQRASLYLAALNLGEPTAKELAEAMGIGRTAIYDNLRVLEEHGYVKTVLHGKRKTFIPLHPRELYKRLDSQKQQLKDLLPDFLALYATKDMKPFVRLFDGPLAAREVYEDILAVTKKEYVYFSPPQLTLQTIDRRYIEQWIQRRVAKGLHSRSLRVKGKVVSNDPIFNNEQPYLRQVRYLPHYMDLKSSIYIYENSIGVISTVKEHAAFILHSPDVSFSLRQIFEFLWGISTKS